MDKLFDFTFSFVSKLDVPQELSLSHVIVPKTVLSSTINEVVTKSVGQFY